MLRINHLINLLPRKLSGILTGGNLYLLLRKMIVQHTCQHFIILQREFHPSSEADWDIEQNNYRKSNIHHSIANISTFKRGYRHDHTKNRKHYGYNSLAASVGLKQVETIQVFFFQLNI